MSFVSALTSAKNYVWPHHSYNHDTQLWETTWMGHKRAYDFDGFLVSDTFQSHEYTIVNTFVPGTTKRTLKKHVLCQRQYAHTGVLTDEVWYDKNGKMATYRSNLQSDAVLILEDGQPSRATTYDKFKEQILPIWDMIQKRTFMINYNLAELTHHFYNGLDNFVKTAPLYHDEQAKIAQNTQENTNETIVDLSKLTENAEVQPVVDPVVPQPEPVKKVTPPRPKLTPEERKARWEERLAQRQEKHAKLLAMKEKVLASKRMNPEKKAARLASLDERLTHNERAQHLLNTRLAALDAAKKRDEWKRVKAERQVAYHALQAKLKQKRLEYKLTKSVLTKEDLAECRQDFKQTTAEKKQALADYRSAIKATKLASVTTRKLKSTKRQKTIFDLAAIVREKDVLERALKTEMDMFKHADMSNRLDVLRFKKRALLNKFKEMSKPRQTVLPSILDMKRVRQPLLPGFQNNIEK